MYTHSPKPHPYTLLSSFDALPSQLEHNAVRRRRSSSTHPIPKLLFFLIHDRLQHDAEGAGTDRHEADGEADEGAGLEGDAAVQEHEGKVHGLMNVVCVMKREEMT